MSGCTACKCDLTIQNTGAGCNPLFGVAEKLFLVPLYNSDGVANEIEYGTTLNQAYLDAAINNADPTERWYPLGPFKNIVDVRAEPIFEEFDDLTKAFIQDSPRIFNGEIIGLASNGAGSPKLKGIIEGTRCGAVGILTVDNYGNVYGSNNSDNTAMRPTALDPQSVYATFTKPSLKNKNVQKLMVGFNIARQEKDENLVLIECVDWNGADLLGAQGLIDACGVFSGLSPTTITVQLYIPSVAPNNPPVVKGLVITDFISSNTAATSKIYDSTANADITISSVTERGAPNKGTYDIVIPNTTVGHVLVLDFAKDGYDATCLVDNTVTVPVT